MFENLFTKNDVFGKIGPDMCRLTPNGQIAVKTSGGYKSYNIEKKRLTNQSNFVFNIGDEFFFVIPTNKVKVGDIIIIQGKPACVIDATSDQIKVINYENSTVDTVVPERHVFMGNTYFYGKIVSLFGSNFKSKKGTASMLKGMMQMSMMQSLFGGKIAFGADNSTNSSDNAAQNSMGNMMQMMMMMNMFSGNSGFGDMFDNMFDFDEDDDTEIIKDLMNKDNNEEDNE